MLISVPALQLGVCLLLIQELSGFAGLTEPQCQNVDFIAPILLGVSVANCSREWVAATDTDLVFEVDGMVAFLCGAEQRRDSVWCGP